jgi:hypothetical protein
MQKGNSLPIRVQGRIMIDGQFIENEEETNEN